MTDEHARVIGVSGANDEEKRRMKTGRCLDEGDGGVIPTSGGDVRKGERFSTTVPPALLL
jgi:hypothetical protein